MSFVIDATEFGLSGLAYTAGARVAPGRYRRIDAPGREVEITAADALPASLDGRVAVYVPVAPPVVRRSN